MDTFLWQQSAAIIGHDHQPSYILRLLFNSKLFMSTLLGIINLKNVYSVGNIKIL